MADDEELFDHQVTPWTVGQLRKALEGIPDDLPVRVITAEDLYSGHEKNAKPCGGSGRFPLAAGNEPPERCWCEWQPFLPHLRADHRGASHA
jgi:hypothetical protein